MDIKVYNQSGKAEGKMTVSDRLFAAPAKADLVYQVATAQMSNKRQVLAHAKTRSEVRGGGKKPWQQKGTGRARHGSIRSPIWRGGGAAHGPSKDANFKKKINVAAARGALAAVISSRVAEGRLVIVDALELASGKTKDAIKLFADLTKHLKDYTAGSRVLVALAGGTTDTMLRRALGNVRTYDAYRATDLNALTVLAYPHLIVTKDAVSAMEKILSKK